MVLSKAFVDTDVLLDVFLARKPFDESASELLTLAYLQKVQLVVSSLAYSNVYYLLRKSTSKATAIEGLQRLNTIVTTASVSNKEIKLALSSGFTDFEDAIQHYTALSAGCQFIITRNVGDYKLSDIPVFAPAEFMKLKVWE